VRDFTLNQAYAVEKRRNELSSVVLASRVRAMSEGDSKVDEREENEGQAEAAPAPQVKAKASGGGSVRPGKRGTKTKAGTVASSRAIMIGVASLGLGCALGWLGHIQKAKAALRADIAAAKPAGSGAPVGPCGAWESKICESSGAQSAQCQQAKGASSLLLASTCEVALGTMPETLAKLKAARASCDKLMDKLCADLPKGSKACDLVKERTPSFPSERCEQMLGSYDKVIAELRQIDAQGAGGPGAGAPHAPPGGMPHGMPPGVSMPPMPAPAPPPAPPAPAPAKAPATP